MIKVIVSLIFVSSFRGPLYNVDLGEIAHQIGYHD
jgi:hypothetical protein